MSEENKVEEKVEQQVHPEVARVAGVSQNAQNALLEIINLVKQLPGVVAGNFALQAEVEKLKAELEALKK